MRIRISACLLILLDRLGDETFASFAQYEIRAGMRLYSERHETAATMWARVDFLWTRFRADPLWDQVQELYGATAPGMIFLLRNYRDQVLEVGMSDHGYHLAIRHEDGCQYFSRDVPADATRVVFWEPAEFHATSRGLHSRATAEAAVLSWLEHSAIDAYLPEADAPS